MSHTTNNAENNHKENSSTELVERVKIPWTPFYLVGREDTGYFVTFGKYKLTETASTKAEAIEHLERSKWDVTARLAGLVMEMMVEEEARIINEQFKKEDPKTYKQMMDEEQENVINKNMAEINNRIRNQELKDMIIDDGLGRPEFPYVSKEAEKEDKQKKEQ